MRAQVQSPSDVSYAYAIDLWTFVWLSDGLVPLPPGDMFWVAAPLSFAATDIRTGGWSAFYDDSRSPLPAGKYAVVGFDYHAVDPESTNKDPTLAARLVFPGQAWRPGIAAVNGQYTRNECAAYDGRLGVLGFFDAFAPPTLEVFAIGTPTAPIKPFASLGLIRIS